ncbi:MAG: hypothetical protein WBL25_05505 [Anaerolineales bacterium]
MAKILAVATHATDDPTKSSLAFITAVGALGLEKKWLSPYWGNLCIWLRRKLRNIFMT